MLWRNINKNFPGNFHNISICWFLNNISCHKWLGWEVTNHNMSAGITMNHHQWENRLRGWVMTKRWWYIRPLPKTISSEHSTCCTQKVSTFNSWVTKLRILLGFRGFVFLTLKVLSLFGHRKHNIPVWIVFNGIVNMLKYVLHTNTSYGT